VCCGCLGLCCLFVCIHCVRVVGWLVDCSCFWLVCCVFVRYWFVSSLIQTRLQQNTHKHMSHTQHTNQHTRTHAHTSKLRRHRPDYSCIHTYRHTTHTHTHNTRAYTHTHTHTHRHTHTQHAHTTHTAHTHAGCVWCNVHGSWWERTRIVYIVYWSVSCGE